MGHDELFEYLGKESAKVFAGDSPSLYTPGFTFAVGRVHDWRNHIPESLIKVWGFLSLQEKRVAMLVAEKAADAEEWE